MLRHILDTFRYYFHKMLHCKGVLDRTEYCHIASRDLAFGNFKYAISNLFQHLHSFRQCKKLQQIAHKLVTNYLRNHYSIAAVQHRFPQTFRDFRIGFLGFVRWRGWLPQLDVIVTNCSRVFLTLNNSLIVPSWIQCVPHIISTTATGDIFSKQQINLKGGIFPHGFLAITCCTQIHDLNQY